MRRPTKLNVLLAGTSAVLALVVVARPELEPRSYAAAGVTQQPLDSPPFNAAEQRRQMLIQLEQMNRRLTSIESKINAGLSVKVTEMPPVRIIDKTEKPERAEKPEK